jgi:signal transduction protein with GAF and PtsI domain
MGLLTKPLSAVWKSIVKSADTEQWNRIRDDAIYDYQVKTRQRLAEIRQIRKTIASGTDMECVFSVIVDKAASIAGAEAAALLGLEADDNLHIYSASGPSGDMLRGCIVPLGRGITGWVAKAGRPRCNPDAYQDPRFDPAGADKLIGFHTTRAMLTVPMIGLNGITSGVIQVVNKVGQKAFDEDDIQFFLLYVAQVTAALENDSRMQQEVKRG